MWEQAFGATDQGLECDDGCTATAALAWLDEAGALNLQTANVGDSSGIWITTRAGAAPQVRLQLCIMLSSLSTRRHFTSWTE